MVNSPRASMPMRKGPFHVFRATIRLHHTHTLKPNERKKERTKVISCSINDKNVKISAYQYTVETRRDTKKKREKILYEDLK